MRTIARGVAARLVTGVVAGLVPLTAALAADEGAPLLCRGEVQFDCGPGGCEKSDPPFANDVSLDFGRGTGTVCTGSLCWETRSFLSGAPTSDGTRSFVIEGRGRPVGAEEGQVFVTGTVHPRSLAYSASLTFGGEGLTVLGGTCRAG